MKKELNGIGRIYKHKEYNNSMEQNRYIIHNKDDIQYFIDYIGDNDFICKHDEFDIFKEAFQYHTKYSKGRGNGKTNNDTYDNMIKYRLELQRLKKFDVSKEIEFQINDIDNNIDDWLFEKPIKPIQKHYSKIDRDYIIGFLDGEGCFTMNDYGNSVSFDVSITQRSDNGNVLYLMKKELNGIGRIYKHKLIDYNEYNHYHIRSKDDIQYFIDYIGSNDFICKHDEFDIFKEAFEFYQKHKPLPGIYKTNTNVYNNMIKYRLELQRLKKFDVSKEIELEVYDYQNNINDWIGV
jgi:hypothetical protein